VRDAFRKKRIGYLFCVDFLIFINYNEYRNDSDEYITVAIHLDFRKIESKNYFLFFILFCILKQHILKQEGKMVKTSKLISEIESLPIDQKTQIVDKILNSLNPGRKEIDELWSREAERRVEEIKLGKVKTIPGEQVLKEVQQRFLK